MNITILKFDSLDSTNTEAANHARLGADEGLCIVARRQTAGRGRHGRTWASEIDAGLYFSIVLRPTLKMRFLPLITLMAGVAVYDTYRVSGWLVFGGTSVASPIIASVYALAANRGAAAYTYSNANALYDVSSGSNGSCGVSYLCTAGSGYDGPTGLGTPNGTNAF